MTNTEIKNTIRYDEAMQKVARVRASLNAVCYLMGDDAKCRAEDDLQFWLSDMADMLEEAEGELSRLSADNDNLAIIDRHLPRVGE